MAGKLLSRFSDFLRNTSFLHVQQSAADLEIPLPLCSAGKNGANNCFKLVVVYIKPTVFDLNRHAPVRKNILHGNYTIPILTITVIRCVRRGTGRVDPTK